MAAKSKVTINYHNVGRVMTSDAMYEQLQKRADTILDNVKEASPVVSGDYVASLTTERALTDRAVIRVVSDVPYAVYVEAHDAPMAIGLMRSKE